jgi:hypothetical protein
MRKVSPIFLPILGSLLIPSATYAAPSAKFAATYSTSPALASVVSIDDATIDTKLVDSKTGYTIATIKVPQDKELMVGLSAEIGLLTDTSIKGKNGGAAKAIAGANAHVTIFATPVGGGDSVMAAPGKVMLSERVQELSATLGGVIQSCTDADLDGSITVAEDCLVTDEEIGLLQSTTAAHHFNFILPNMPQGNYEIKAVFSTGATGEIDICDEGEECSFDPEGTVSATANATAVINKTMMTVQQVRATQTGIIEADIIE